MNSKEVAENAKEFAKLHYGDVGFPGTANIIPKKPVKQNPMEFALDALRKCNEIEKGVSTLGNNLRSINLKVLDVERIMALDIAQLKQQKVKHFETNDVYEVNKRIERLEGKLELLRSDIASLKDSRVFLRVSIGIVWVTMLIQIGLNLL